jgi:hypothetical protein
MRVALFGVNYELTLPEQGGKKVQYAKFFMFSPGVGEVIKVGWCKSQHVETCVESAWN